MRSRRLPWILTAATILGFSIYLAGIWDRLPGRMATHFGVGGEADGWSSKLKFLVIGYFMVAMFAGIFGFLSHLLHKAPTQWINMPNKHYWLAPERREQTLARLQPHLDWMGFLSIVFLLYAMQRVAAANLAPEAARLPRDFAYGTVAFVAAFLVWGIGLPMSFRRLPPGRSSGASASSHSASTSDSNGNSNGNSNGDSGR